MTSHIAVLNESTVELDFDMSLMVKALRHKLAILRQMGYLVTTTVDFYDTKGGVDKMPKNATPLVLLDNSDQAGALGYHDVTDDGKAIAKVFVKDTMKYGLEVTVTIDHEFTETACDERARLCWDLGEGILLAYENCDQVEADAYGFDYHGIRMSDTVTPEWFEPNAKGPYDWTRQLETPLTLAPGGYIGVYEDGQWTQVTSERRSPNPNGVSRSFFAKRIWQRRETPVAGLTIN